MGGKNSNPNVPFCSAPAHVRIPALTGKWSALRAIHYGMSFAGNLIEFLENLINIADNLINFLGKSINIADKSINFLDKLINIADKLIEFEEKLVHSSGKLIQVGLTWIVLQPVRVRSDPASPPPPRGPRSGAIRWVARPPPWAIPYLNDHAPCAIGTAAPSAKPWRSALGLACC